MNRLNDKIVLVTGAADGIGAAAGRELAAAGATLILTDINLEGVQQVARSIGPKAVAMELNVCDPGAWQKVLDDVVSEHGKLDVLVNNAGGAGAGTIEDISIDDYRNAMTLNIDSVFIGSKLAIEKMKTSGGGNIINVSSIHGIRAAAHAASYSAAKGAVRLLTKSVALHCAEKGYNIRCNSIHPGYILTTQMIDWVNKAEDPGAVMADLVSKHPIGFLGQPEDIGKGIVFLASDDSRFMTGQELVMDGGFTLI